MITGQDIIYITSDWIRENKTSTHHIAEELSRHNRLLYIEAAGMRAPRASRRDARKVFTKLRKIFARPSQVMANIYLFTPFIIPLHQYRFVRWLNSVLLSFSLRRALRAVEFHNPILWIFMPHFAAVIRSLEARGLVYYITDEYTATPHVKANVIRAMENEILDRADVVFAVSDELRARKSTRNPNVYVSPHGVDIEFFAKAAKEDTPIPDDISAIPKPIAGFFGLIEDYIDTDLIAHLATGMTDVSFVMIGRALQDVSRLKTLPNVYFLGHRPYSSLAGYLKAFDASLLLYRIGSFSKNANPKKLREYLAGGKPIVSVRIPEVERYSELVYIADDYQEFGRFLREAIEHDTADMKARRIAAMETESWGARVGWIGDMIKRHIPDVAGEPSRPNPPIT